MAVINTNILSTKSQHNIQRSQTQLNTAIERLSSGSRINSAKDDAAGSAISNRMQTLISGTKQATRNANDAISYAQTANAILSSVNEKLQRIRELSVQALNDTLSTRDKDMVQSEINWSLKEIDRLVETANFNGIQLLNGSTGKLNFQVGALQGQNLSIDMNGPGFGVAALGLEDLNIAGLNTSISERNTLQGEAQDIRLYAPSTSINSPGSTLPLRYTSELGYYTSNGAGNFQRVNVSAIHDTASDSSSVNITSTQLLHSNTLISQPVTLPALASNQRLVEQGGSYYLQQRYGDGSISYQAMSFDISYSGTSASASATANPNIVTDSYSAVGNVVTKDGTNYDLANATNISLRSAGGGLLSGAELVTNSAGELYLTTGSGNDQRYFQVANVATTERLLLSAANSPSVGVNDADISVVSDNFSFAGENYNLNDFDQQVLSPSPATLVRDNNDNLFLRQNNAGSWEYFALNDLDTEYDLTFRADSQAFRGADLSAGTIINPPRTPSSNFTNFGPVQFSGADFSGLSNLTVVQEQGAGGQWAIRGTRADGAQAYFRADLQLSTNAQGVATQVQAVATEAEPWVLGLSAHERDTVSGISQITLDPRNVEVLYTDAAGNSYSDVLRANDDGTYYFKLPGASSAIGGYKTATLVDLDSNGDVVLRTLNGGSEIAVFYASNLNSGLNLSVNALSDADGFDNSGVAQTRLHIQELGDDFRLRFPANPLAAIDRAIGLVDAKRSYLGAIENRFESIIDGNQALTINLSAAKSRIMDTDYAHTSSELVRAQILNQVGQSMLAQANAVPETVLALLAR